MSKIKLGYFTESAHTKFANKNNWYNRKLAEYFDIEIVDYRRADFVLFSEKRIEENLAFKIPPNAIRIFLTGENVRPDFNQADFALTHDYNENIRHLRFSLLRHYITGWETQPRNWHELSKQKTRFCNFMYSNPTAKERIIFFHQLSKYKKVDSAGRLLNNMGGAFIENKIEFLNSYKFTIAFENSSFPGYSTEKLIQPLMVGSIPIYWGDTEIEKDINPDCFINVHNYDSYNEVIEIVNEIDNDYELWRKYVLAPVFRNNKIPEHLKEERFVQFFNAIFKTKQHQIPVVLKRKQNLMFFSNSLLKFIKRVILKICKIV